MSKIDHPGLLLAEKIKQGGFKQNAIAAQLNIGPSQFNEILKGKRPLNAALCIGIEKLFGLNARAWHHKQADYELQQARIAAHTQSHPTNEKQN